MKSFTKVERTRIKTTYGSMEKYREFLWNEIRLANAFSLDGNPFHLDVRKKAEELYERSFLRGGK